MQPINVLYLVRTWAFGGSHTIVLSLLEHLSRDTVRIHCVPYDAHSSGDADFIDQAAAHNVPIDHARIPWHSNRDWFRARSVVSALIHEHNIDLIHTHDPHSNILVGLGRNRWPVPLVASAYGWWDGPIGRRRLHQRIERDFALPHFDRVITVSKNMQDRVLEGRTSPDRIRVVPTGLMPQTSGTSTTLRKHFNIPEKAIVVGTLGRVSAEKGHRYLLDAVHASCDEFPELYCVIVGTGPALSELKLQSAKLGLEERVVFTGFWEDRGDALNAFDFFALPSTQREGLPTSVLEAQQAGLPVIASDIGGTAETINAGRTGILVTPANVSTLSAAIRALVSDAEGREAMGKAARAWVAERFSMRTMIDHVSSVYQEAIHEFENARSH